MLKKSHRSFGAAMAPIMFLPIKSTNNEIINTLINNYNYIFLKISEVSIENIVISILMLLIYMLGTTLPDLDMKLKYLFPKNMRSERFRYHRQITHSLLLWIGLLIYSLYKLPDITDYYYLLSMLSLGVMTHLIGDMLTGSIPWLLYGHYGIRFSRIGITVFLPKSFHEIFTKKLSSWFNKNLWVFIILFLLNLSILIYIKMWE